MTLIEFLRTRLDELEKMAEAVAAEAGRDWDPGHEMMSGTVNTLASGGNGYLLCAPFEADLSWPMRQYLAYHDPARVLAEVEAKRRIVEDCASYETEDHAPTDALSWRVLQLLALPYADHSDYDSAWRP